MAGARRKAARWGGRAAVALVVVALVALGLLFFFLRTQPGQRFVLRQVLSRVQGAVDGEIVIGDVRAEDLRSGATLYNVAIVGPGGEPFLDADSVRVAYDWRTFLSGDVVLSELVLYQPTVLIARRPGEEQFNFARIFRTGEERPDTAAPAAGEVVLRDVAVVDGSVEVLYPEEGERQERALYVETSAEDTPPLRRMVFDSIYARLPEIVASSPGDQGPVLTFADLALVGQVYEDPFVVRDLEGRLTVPDGVVRLDAERLVLGNSVASAQVSVDLGDDEGLELALDLTTDGLFLQDLQWFEPRIPDGRVEGGLQLALGPTGQSWTFEALEVVSQGDEVRLDGGLEVADGAVALEDLDVRASPLDLDRLDPWLAQEPPLDGTVRGRVTLDGTFASLAATGELTLDEPGTGPPVTRAVFDGVLDLEGDRGVSDLRATLDPLDWDLVTRLFPDVTFGGSGRVELRADGSLDAGLSFTAEAVHETPDLPTSRLFAEGTVWERGDDFVLDVRTRAEPLSFTTLARYFPQVPLQGDVSGTVIATGPLGDLSVVTDLRTPAGELALDARFDARDPGAFYRISGDVAGFQLHELVPALPQPTVITGEIFLEGRGTELATASLEARVRAFSSEVGGVLVDTAVARFALRDGQLVIDTVDAMVGGVELHAAGTLGVEEGDREGTVTVAFDTESINRLRPLLMPGPAVPRESIAPFRAELLDIDPDSLPTQEDLRLSGAADGRITLSGSLQSFAAEGTLSLEEIGYGPNFLRGADITFSGTRLPSLDGELHAEIEADSLQLFDRTFRSGTLDVDYTRPEGEVQVFLQRTETEDYRATAAFQVDTAGGRVELEELALRFDTTTWALTGPATVAWAGEGVTVRGLEIVRPGPSPLRIAAEGTLPLGEAVGDFQLDVEGVRLDRLTRLLQMEELDLHGLAELHVEVQGTAEAPVIDGAFSVEDVDYGAFDLSLLEGDLRYADERVALNVDGWGGDRRFFNAEGTVPLDLSLGPFAFDVPVEPVDLRVTTDSLPVSVLVGNLEAVEGIGGALTAALEVGGTADAPTVVGDFQVRDLDYESVDLTRVGGEVAYAAERLRLDVGAWTDELQVLTVEGTVPVDLALTVSEDRFPEEEIDLTVVADSLPSSLVLGYFDAITEVDGRVSGRFAIGGTLDDPETSGTVAVQQTAFTLPDVGVRYSDVRGTLELQQDGTVVVDAIAEAGGTVEVTGTIGLEPLTNPSFDLLFQLGSFQAVDRPDIEGAVSGTVALTGTFERPFLEGSESQGRGLTVDRGTLFLEEFLRQTTVVDLSDPGFVLSVDTAFTAARPLIAESRNPFLDGLRVAVDLEVDQDVWLRSADMNVEMEGDLIVTFQRRPTPEVVLIGQLDAVRGDYTIFNRRFQVESGVVEFVGQPGINPNLNITAVTEVRRPQGEPLDIVASVVGTLENPRVELSTPADAVAESDLVSYLLFGRPSYALTASQTSLLDQSGLIGTAVGQAASIGVGAFSSQLGNLFAREIGADYFAITQAGEGILGGGLAASFAQTTVEVGQYLTDDLFAVLVLRPLSDLGVGNSRIFGGVRLEWAPTDLYTLEAFVEDRFLRSPAFGFQEIALQTEYIFGLFVFTEWGY